MPMLNKNAHNPHLYTFGVNQLAHELQSQSNKFPFTSLSRPKKSCHHQRNVSKQRRRGEQQKLESTAKSNKFSMTKKYNLKDQMIECLKSRKSIENDQQNRNTLQNPRYQSCEKKKSSLPKVFQMRSHSNKKRVICSETNFRNDRRDSPQNFAGVKKFEIEPQSVQDYDLGVRMRPKSMMFLADYTGSQLHEHHKLKTIPEKRIFRKERQIKGAEIKGIDNQILQHIKVFKKIYQ